jgi:S1-C subfamily serine protease
MPVTQPKAALMLKPSRKCMIGFQLLIVGLSAAFSPLVNANELDIKKLQAKIYSAVNKALPAAVAINDRGSIFSGVIVSSDGLVLSAGHAVRSNRGYTVMLADGRRLRAIGLGVNERVDMAMLKILKADNLPVAEMGYSSAVVANQPCISISYPGLYDSKRGAVIRFGYVNRPITNNEGMIETTAMMEPGDSGGPLLDLDGKVIGIHSNIRQSTSKNYDVPIDSFRQYWEQLQQREEFKISGWPSLPKLGFHAEEKNAGVVVTQVYEGGLAEASGLKPDDLITAVSGKRVKSQTRIFDRLIELRSTNVNAIEISVLRKTKPVKIMIVVSDVKHPKPAAYPELRNLAKMFQPLESKLDNVQFVVRSKINEVSTQVWATRIFRSGRGNVISKSTRVGDQPQIELANGSRVDAKVVARDPINDLVLLHAEFIGLGGIDLSNVIGDLQEQPGRLLLIPDANGEGQVSIWGSKYFNVPRTRASGGYLGVMLATDRDSGKVVFDEVVPGAARSAGLKSGDLLLKLNGVEIKRQPDVTNTLRQLDPRSVIELVIQRDGAELTKEVVLGNRPDDTGHVADDIIGGKSDRRDGFSLAISHDANLRPRQCGGPVFDIDGNFLGINIARFSRTRCYVIPRTILKRFVDEFGQ